MFLPTGRSGAGDCAGKRPKFNFTPGCRQLQQTVVSTIGLRCIYSKSVARTPLLVEEVQGGWRPSPEAARGMQYHSVDFKIVIIAMQRV